MALNQTNKLVWLVETIYKARQITFEELNRQWMDNVDLSGGEEMLKRTFHKWKWNIFDTFGLMIECEKAAPYRYYIENVEDMRNGGIEKLAPQHLFSQQCPHREQVYQRQNTT